MSGNSTDGALLELMHHIAVGDTSLALACLAAAPQLARCASGVGASRQETTNFFLDPIQHYIYRGDTALHIAAAAFRTQMVQELLARNASCAARNRRGAQPLHYAADTNTWDPQQQSATIVLLLEAGASPDAQDSSGTGVLHRAVHTNTVAPLLHGSLS